MKLDTQKGLKNEQKFGHWKELSNGGRLYWYEVIGQFGCSACYFKEVDAKEKTVRFYQEIYNDKGELIEIHEKYPKDKGHKRISEE